MELGRLCFVTDHAQEAADAFAIVMPAIENPDDFGLSDNQKKMFVGERGGCAALELFAEAFLAADRPDDALAAYERLERLQPNKALHAYHLARVSECEEMQPQQALATCKRISTNTCTPAEAAPYKLLAQLLDEAWATRRNCRAARGDRGRRTQEQRRAASPGRRHSPRPTRTTRPKRSTRSCSRGNRTKTSIRDLIDLSAGRPTGRSDKARWAMSRPIATRSTCWTSRSRISPKTKSSSIA